MLPARVWPDVVMDLQGSHPSIFLSLYSDILFSECLSCKTSDFEALINLKPTHSSPHDGDDEDPFPPTQREASSEKKTKAKLQDGSPAVDEVLPLCTYIYMSTSRCPAVDVLHIVRSSLRFSVCSSNILWNVSALVNTSIMTNLSTPGLWAWFGNLCEGWSWDLLFFFLIHLPDLFCQGFQVFMTFFDLLLTYFWLCHM